MVFWTHKHVFDHSWETVVEAAWKKYPNPINPAVTSVDVLDRAVDDSGVLRTDRILSTHWNIPNWATKLIGLDNPSFGYEKSEVDPVSKEFTLRSCNLNCTNFVSVDERLVYKPHPEDPSKTVLEQETHLHMRNVPFVSNLENILASAFKSNGSKGPQCMEWVIDNIVRECSQMSHKISDEYHELSRKFEGIELKLKEGPVNCEQQKTPTI